MPLIPRNPLKVREKATQRSSCQRPSTGLNSSPKLGEGGAQHEAEGLLTRRSLEVFFSTVGIGGGGVVFAIDESERSARCRCLIAAVEVVGSVFALRATP